MSNINYKYVFFYIKKIFINIDFIVIVERQTFFLKSII